MNRMTALTVLFVVLTVAFSAVSVVEYTEIAKLNTEVSTEFTTVTGSQSSGSFVIQTSHSLGTTGEIVVGNVGTYDFEAANYQSPNTFTYENVTFTSTPQVTTGAVCAEFNATVLGGQTFPLAACAFDVYISSGPSPGMVMQSVIAFSNQTTPAVGVMLLSDRTAYVLVRSGP